MKRIKTYLSLLFIVNCFTLYSQTNIEQLDNDSVKRELLKEYFLCVCITEGFNGVKQNDISLSIYFDIIGYAPVAFEEVSDFAKKFIASIKPSIIEDLGNKKAVIMLSIEKYKSSELNMFIKSMDKYILDK
jgi:hypothetical protein